MKQPTSEVTCVEYPSRVFGEPFALSGDVEPLASGGDTSRSPKKKRSMIWMGLQQAFHSAGRHYLLLAEARANGWAD